MNTKFWLVVFSGFMASGCTGTVVMSPLDPVTIRNNYTAGTDTLGIIVYRAIPKTEVDEFTQINIPNTAKPDGPLLISDVCSRKQIKKVVSVADAEHPYRLHYEHGFLETYTFGATLTNDGILTVVNSQSTPDQGKTVQNLAATATSIGGLVKAPLKEPELPDCTITPSFVRYE